MVFLGGGGVIFWRILEFILEFFYLEFFYFRNSRIYLWNSRILLEILNLVLGILEFILGILEFPTMSSLSLTGGSLL